MGNIEHWAATAATLVDLAKRDLPPHISEAEQVEAYLWLKRAAADYRGAVDALAELVRLKDGPRDAAYRAAKDAAWGAAREVRRRAEGRLMPEKTPYGDSTVYLWRCTHELCGRVVEAGDVGYLQHTYRADDAAVEVARIQLGDPPKCIGRHRGNGGYTSHRASPMELVAFAPVASQDRTDAR